MTVKPVADLAEGVRLANAGRYALGGSVFTKNKKAGMRAARAMRSGDGGGQLGDVVPERARRCRSAGSGESGFGRIHGADGLREFTRAKSITRQRMKPMSNLTSFTRTDKDMKQIMTLVTMLHGKRYK